MKCNLTILFFYVCLALSAQENPYQEAADKLFQAKEYEEAFRLYGNAIKIDRPEENNFQLFLNAGDCAYLLNFKHLAFNYYGQSALRNVPANELIAHLDMYCHKDSICVIETLKKIVQKYPETQDYLNPEIAAVLFNRSEYEEAIPILRECLVARSNNFFIQKMLAESFFYIGKMDSAYVLYKGIVEYHFNDYDSYVFLGSYHYTMANKLSKTATEPEEKRPSFSFLKKRETKENVITECYNKAAQYLEKAYTIYNSDEIKKSLIEIYTITGRRDKISFYRKETKNR